MKLLTYWKLIEKNGNAQSIEITSDNIPEVTKTYDGAYRLSVDGVSIYFDNKIVRTYPHVKGGEQ